MWGAVPAAAASTSASSSTSTKTTMLARLLKPQHDWLRIFLSSSALSFESTHSRFVLWLSTRSSLTIKCRTKARLSAAQLSPPRRATRRTSRTRRRRHRRPSHRPRAPAGDGATEARPLESRRGAWREDRTDRRAAGRARPIVSTHPRRRAPLACSLTGTAPPAPPLDPSQARRRCASRSCPTHH